MLKLIEINGKKFVMNFVATGPDTGFQLQCLDQEREQSYTESLAPNDFTKRLKTLNARVKFPEDDVRVVLVSGDPTHTSLSEANQEGAGCVLKLKYKLLNNMPLKWEWHLTHMERASFYRKVFLDSISCASKMREQVFALTKQLQAKDEELKQYRIEGAQLRRGTVATKLFDLEAFNVMNEQTLAYSANYRQLTEALDIKDSSIAHFHGKTEASKVSDPTRSPASHSSKPTQKLSPRNRKRKAMESNKDHIERKVLRRRAQGKLEFKESQSTQEEIVGDFIPLHEAEAAAHVKQEPSVVNAQNINNRPDTEANLEQEEPPVVKVQNVKKEIVDPALNLPVTAENALLVESRKDRNTNQEERRSWLERAAECEASIFKPKFSVDTLNMMDLAATEPPVAVAKENLIHSPIYDLDAHAAPSGLASVLGSLKEMESFISKAKDQF
ncbi:uncharacterized protein LOC117579093 [Drosophila guanche]|uniref:Uncharacterized protein n=1 Tax=Drosophila guanche TaxID=7266 RepID=A0A3B0IY94_DROGU|nr:uncharacterized protein LOC117579093 [Drosophila guanche]SPP72735.1 Hypothetical predicted protein [Drosophila guanche]